jgi:epoxyqueuosine reductase
LTSVSQPFFLCGNLSIVLSLTEKIKQKSAQIGFDKIGIVPADALTYEAKNLQNWLEKGYQAEMKWLEREPEKRTDPRQIFPAAQSVIVVALNYFTPHEHDQSAAKGKVSRYAWGDDYHDVMGEKLRELLSFIKSENIDADGKICCDIQPMMDKAWAVRAGIGWLGKHSNVITKEFGSWFFIGEILLNLPLDYDNSIENDHCGNCTACIDACPTGAIVSPYTVDSNACLSYATIELRSEELPKNITPNLDGWLYGCDVCQDVCPWNRFEKPTNEARFEPRKGLVSPDLIEIAEMTQEVYVEKFRRSAMKRTKLKGLQRNARALQQNLTILFGEEK